MTAIGSLARTAVAAEDDGRRPSGFWHYFYPLMVLMMFSDSRWNSVNQSAFSDGESRGGFGIDRALTSRWWAYDTGTDQRGFRVL
jgi:hypothetical protein